MPPDSGGVCMGVDSRNHQFAHGLPPGWHAPPWFLSTCGDRTSRTWCGTRPGKRSLMRWPSSTTATPRDALSPSRRYSRLVSQNILVNQFQKVNSPTKSLTYCWLFLIRILSWRFCGGVHFLKLINEFIVSDKKIESSLNLWRRTVNLMRPERARNEGYTGPTRLDATRCATYQWRINYRTEALHHTTQERYLISLIVDPSSFMVMGRRSITRN